MQTNQVYDVVCVGNYTKDTIVTPAGVRIVDGGAVNYAAHAGVKLGCKVLVVTRLAYEDYERVIGELRSQGVDCLVKITPDSTCIRLEYPGENPDERKLSVTATAGTITAQEVQGFRSHSAAIGATLRGEIELETIQALRGKTELLAADVQGFVRVLDGESLVFRPWERMAEILQYLDVLKADAKEAEFLTGESDLRQAARRFAALGPQEILLTHAGGLILYAQGKFTEASFYSREIKGRSGRGDTCLGSYIARRVSDEPQEAALWSAALTSLKMEKEGPFRGEPVDVARLVESRYR